MSARVCSVLAMGTSVRICSHYANSEYEMPWQTHMCCLSM